MVSQLLVLACNIPAIKEIPIVMANSALSVLPPA